MDTSPSSKSLIRSLLEEARDFRERKTRLERELSQFEQQLIEVVHTFQEASLTVSVAETEFRLLRRDRKLLQWEADWREFAVRRMQHALDEAENRKVELDTIAGQAEQAFLLSFRQTEKDDKLHSQLREVAEIAAKQANDARLFATSLKAELERNELDFKNRVEKLDNAIKECARAYGEADRAYAVAAENRREILDRVERTRRRLLRCERETR